MAACAAAAAAAADCVAMASEESTMDMAGRTSTEAVVRERWRT